METKTSLSDVSLVFKDSCLVIERKDGFLSMGKSISSGCVGTIKSIVICSLKSSEDPSPSSFKNDKKSLEKFLEENKVLEPTAISIGNYDLKKSVNVTIDKVTAIITVDDALATDITVMVNEKLDEPALLELYKASAEAKAAALWDLGLISSFSLDLFDSGKDDTILVVCNGFKSTPNEKVDELRLLVGRCVREAADKILRDYGYPKDVLGYMEDVGVTMEDLVYAGMQLCVGVDKTPEISNKLRKQLLKSLEDLNVVSLIMAGIRLEEDYARHRVRGVDVDDDPAYLYSDEVFGMAVANQIAGTKAIFNFKRYDEEKPGVLGVLGPVIDDIFAGLIAGCMSKIFEG